MAARSVARTAPLVLLALLAACGKEPPPPTPPEGLRLTPVAFQDIPGWRDDAVSEALPALLRTCARLARVPADRMVSARETAAVAGTAAEWRAPCAPLAQAADGGGAAARAVLQAWYRPFRAEAGNAETGLVTGYYEAELTGALEPNGRATAPIYARPRDLVTADLGAFAPELGGKRVVGRVVDGALRPYLTRAEIEAGALDGRARPLLWADDPIDVFFLQVQGSGKVRLEDGSERRIGFAASNGHDFTAIGRLLLDEGKVPREQASMQGIRQWLRDNPREAQAVMARNKRYIFFRWIDGDGPIGAEGVALTPGRSLAIDPSLVPLGTPLFIDTADPVDGAPLRRLMVAQDSGAAIKGPLRADFFWGSGDAALAYAGGMKQQARFYLLLPKAVAARVTPTG